MSEDRPDEARPTDRRLRKLAKDAARMFHCRWKEGTKQAVESGHVGAFDSCPHPDCVLVRDAALSAEAAEARVRQLEQERDTVRLELTVLGEETERYVRQAEALLVRLRTLPRHEVGLMDGREHAYAEVVKWTDLEAILPLAVSVAAPFDDRIFCPTCGRRRVVDPTPLTQAGAEQAPLEPEGGPNGD